MIQQNSVVSETQTYNTPRQDAVPDGWRRESCYALDALLQKHVRLNIRYDPEVSPPVWQTHFSRLRIESPAFRMVSRYYLTKVGCSAHSGISSQSSTISCAAKTQKNFWLHGKTKGVDWTIRIPITLETTASYMSNLQI